MDWLEEELRENDKQEFPGRLARFKEIDEWFQVPPGGLSFDFADQTPVMTLSEARFAYVNGFWISAILMSLVAIERHLAWRLLTANKPTDPGRRIALAVDAAFMTEEQATIVRSLQHYRETLPEAASASIQQADMSRVIAEEAVQVASAYFLEAGRDPLSDG